MGDLFGGGGGIASYLVTIAKAVVLLATASQIPIIDVAGKVGGIFDAISRSDSTYMTGHFNPDAFHPDGMPWLTIEDQVQYAQQYYQNGMDRIENMAEVSTSIVEGMPDTQAELGNVELALAATTGGIDALQQIGATGVINGKQLNNISAQLGMLGDIEQHRLAKETWERRKQAAEAEAFFGEEKPLGFTPVLFDPWSE